MSDTRTMFSLVGGTVAVVLAAWCAWTGNTAYGISAIALALLFRAKF